MRLGLTAVAQAHQGVRVFPAAVQAAALEVVARDRPVVVRAAVAEGERVLVVEVALVPVVAPRDLAAAAQAVELVVRAVRELVVLEVALQAAALEAVPVVRPLAVEQVVVAPEVLAPVVAARDLAAAVQAVELAVRAVRELVAAALVVQEPAVALVGVGPEALVALGIRRTQMLTVASPIAKPQQIGSTLRLGFLQCKVGAHTATSRVLASQRTKKRKIRFRSVRDPKKMRPCSGPRLM